jgi:hypothetical protein
MIPIYEQGSGQGIGHGLKSFLKRFDAICQEHKTSKRAKAFAFIFYDFIDQDLRRILKNQGVFAQLDRLSGTELSIFYLHTGTEHAINEFNAAFLTALQLEGKAKPPCVVFFKLGGEGFEDIAVAQLNNADLIHGFKELYEVIERYIKTSKEKAGAGLKSLIWVKSALRFVSIEALRAALRKGFEYLPF